MDAERRDEEQIFYAAVAIDSATERAAFVKAACGDDVELLRRVEDLLRIHYEDDRFLMSSPAGNAITLGSSPLTEGPGTVIGRYKLLQLIGEGGFGCVYMAEQQQPLRRRVALKIIKLGMDTKQVIARFEAERQALAMMDHPNIARVFDAGATETGRPYFVMELVRGTPITEYCDQNNLGTRERLELFVEVCKAVQHAHQKGIIHRDIKPSNVMITLHDGRPVPKVIDFGIAKATQHRLTERTLFTEYAQFIGTPEYMSPEQAEMSELDVDTRSDIYSLGVLLYELLTGTTPFEATKLRSAAYDEIRRIIREDEPPKPSTRLSTLGDILAQVARHRCVQPGELCRMVRGDLDWIVMKTLEKDRTRRYETASDLAGDVDRHLSHEPVAASPPSAAYRIRKFLRRNRTLVTGAAIVLLVLLAGVVVSTILAVGQSRARKQADTARILVEAARQTEAAARIDAETARSKAEKAEKTAEEQRLQMQQLLVRAQYERGIQRLNEGDQQGMLDLLEAWQTAENYPRLRASISRLWAIAHDLSRERLVYILPDPIHGVSPDGKLLVTFSGKTAQLWEIGTWQRQGPLLELENPIDTVKFSPDSRLLLAHSGHGVSRLWDTATGRPSTPILRHAIGTFVDVKRAKGALLVDFSPDGRLLATAYFDGTVPLWDVATGEPYGKPVTHEKLEVVVFSPDGGLLATGGHDRAQLWEVASGQPHGMPLKSGGAMEQLLFSPDGRLLAAKDAADFHIYVWDIETGQLYRTLRHGAWLYEMAISPDGKLLAAGSQDCAAVIWDIASGKRIGQTTPHRRGVDYLAFSSDGKLLATSSRGDSSIRLWDVAAGKPYGHCLHSANSGMLAFCPDTAFLVSPGNRIWSAHQQLCAETIACPSGASYSAFGSDQGTGALILGNAVRLWDTAGKQGLGEPFEHEDRVTCAAFSPDGRILACSYGGFYPISPGMNSGEFGVGYLRLWDIATGQPLGPILKNGYTYALAFSLDGQQLASGTIGSTAELFDVARREHTRSFTCGGYVCAVAFSADGRILATGLIDATVKLWDIVTGRQIGSTLILPSAVVSVAFSPDGNLLATVCGDEEPTVQIWDIGSDPPCQSVTLPRLTVPRAEVLKYFTRDGVILVSRVGPGQAQAWRLPEAPTDLHEMRLKTWIALGARGNPLGQGMSVQADSWQGLRQELVLTKQAHDLQLVESASPDSHETAMVWSPGPDAAEYDVYWGADPNGLECLGRVQGNTYADLPDLKRDAVYWWRIDMVKADGSISPGTLWTSRTCRSGLVGWWKLDETSGDIAHDSSGNDRHGRWKESSDAGPPHWNDIGGRRGGALEFDGVNDYVDFGSGHRLGITDAVTLALWVNTDDCGNGEHNPYLNIGDHSFGIKHHELNSIEFFIYDADWHIVRHPVDKSFNHTWHHLAGTYDGSLLKLYIDGALVGQASHTGSIAASTFNVNMGRNSEWTKRFYAGLMDDVTLFNRALDSSEIVHLMNEGGALFASDPSLKALWQLDESTGDGVADSSGNGMDGMLNPSSPHRAFAGPQWVEGRLGGALQFDGVDDYVAIDCPDVGTGLGSSTLTLWIKTTESRNVAVLGTFNDKPQYYSGAYEMNLNRQTDPESKGSTRFYLRSADNRWLAGYIETDIYDGQWHHVAWRIEEAASNRVDVYVDGARQDMVLYRNDSPYWFDSFNYPLFLGARNARGVADGFSQVTLDDVRVYNYSLSEAEVAAIYAGQEPELPNRRQWLFSAEGEDVAPLSFRTDSKDVYRVPLKSEYYSQEQNLHHQLEDLNALSSVLTGLDRVDPNSVDVAHFYYRCALANLHAGNEEGYRKICSKFFGQYGGTDRSVLAERLLWTCALAPQAVEDFGPVIQLAEQSVESGGKMDENLTSLGAVLYRAGRFTEAVQTLGDLAAVWEQGNELSANTSPAYTCFFLAMAHHQLGNADESRRYFELGADRASGEITGDEPWTRRLTLQLLRKEAAELLGRQQAVLPAADNTE